MYLGLHDILVDTSSSKGNYHLKEILSVKIAVPEALYNVVETMSGDEIFLVMCLVGAYSALGRPR